MHEDETPVQAIERHRIVLAALSDEAFLERLRNVPSMPDGGMFDPAWEARPWWDQMYLLVAFADEIGARRLVSAIAPLYERLPLDDPGGVTQTFRHGPERATEGRDEVLVQILQPLLRHRRQGTRRAAAAELGILRDPIVADDLALVARDDPVADVRSEACFALWLITGRVDDAALRSMVTDVLRVAASQDSSEDVRYRAADLLADFDPEAAAPLQQPKVEWFADPTWIGHTSGRDAFQATRRVIRALITGHLSRQILTAVLDQSASHLVMTPGAGVYPTSEPSMPADRTAPDWRARIALWMERDGSSGRIPTGLAAEIELRRASPEEVRARLVDVIEDQPDGRPRRSA